MQAHLEQPSTCRGQPGVSRRKAVEPQRRDAVGCCPPRRVLAPAGTPTLQPKVTGTSDTAQKAYVCPSPPTGGE